MSSPGKCNALFIVTLVCSVVVTDRVCSQDVGSFLAGLLGGGSTSNNEAPTNETVQDQAPCPGECVHAFTSILCSRVVEQFDCGAGYLRCCVSSDFTFGTVVETSAPLPEESSTETSGDYDLFLLTTVPNGGATTKQTPHPTTASQPEPFSHSATPTRPHTAVTHKPRPCPGICVENIFVRYCSSTVPDGICDRGSTCCVSNTDDSDNPPLKVSTTVSSSTTTTTTTTTTATPPTTTADRNKYVNQPFDQYSRPGEGYIASTLPPCPGSCVAPLFSLLCDAVDDNYYCGNDGRCCISVEEPYTKAPPTQPPTTTTTTSPSPSSIPCPGACIPIFLRGMCNRPSEVIPLTDCEYDFVCCYQPDIKEYLHIEAQQIPLLRPGASQPGYPSIPVPQSNVQHFGQPAVNHHFSQGHQVPHAGQPIIVPNVQNQGNGNQIYLGNSRPGYPVPPVHPSRPVPQSHEGTVIKIPYQPNTNYDYNPYSQQNFVPIQKQNSTSELQPVRLSVLAPASYPGTVHAEEIYSNRYNGSLLVQPQASQHSQSSVHPQHGSEKDPVRFIAPQPPVLGGPQIRPEDNKHQQHPSMHNRFVETAIGFAPDTVRPVKINVPPLEKFHPPSPPPSFIPPLRNASTILVLHVDNPDDIEVIEDVEIKPAVIDSSIKTAVINSHVKPAIIDMPVKPAIIDSGFRPVQDSFKPLMPQAAYKPTPIPTPPTTSAPLPAAPVYTKPLLPMEDNIPNPSNSNFYTISAEQAKKIRPACPGSCIASFLRFTCFGNNAIYDGFSCEGGSSIMCCSSVDYIEKYEEHLKSGNPLTFVKPDFDAQGSHPAPVETTRRPGMYVCGIKGTQRRRTARIMGGRTAFPGEWCWQVALINAKNQYLCGGALIGSRWVLTAAHCITALIRNGDPIYVRVGDFDLASQVGSPGAQTQKVSTSYVHHNHNGQTLDNDIALLRLENPVQLQDSVCLVCLPARGAESQPGKRCKVTGYGYLSESGPIALKVREAELPIVEETLCTQQINNVTEKRFIMPAGSFCAGGEPENDACQGDGGGPLTCLNEGYYELTGLVSWGFGCGKENVPGVYVKVSSYIGWVNQIISVNN